MKLEFVDVSEQRVELLKCSFRICGHRETREGLLRREEPRGDIDIDGQLFWSLAHCLTLREKKSIDAARSDEQRDLDCAEAHRPRFSMPFTASGSMERSS